MIEPYLSDKNLLPENFRKKVYKWCGAGAMVKVTYLKAGGFRSTKLFEEAAIFADLLRPIDDCLGFLGSMSKEFSQLVETKN